jgi:hypothetical protein
MMNPHEKNMFYLAETLSTPVFLLLDMPVSEYFGWMRHFRERAEEQERQQRKKDGDLLALDSSADFVSAMLK